MIVDSSALVAILQKEHGANELTTALARSTVTRISAATFVEVGIVMDRRGDPRLSVRLDDLIALHAISIESVTERQARIARQAHRDYGRGSGHPAALNFGDCFAYALARDTGEPLLYVGDDFARTDIRSALP